MRKIWYTIVGIVVLLTHSIAWTAASSESTMGGSQGDFLEQWFFPSRAQQQIINLWTNKQAVGNELLRESTTLNLQMNDNAGQGCFINGSLVSNFKRNFCEQQLQWDWMKPAGQDPTGHAGVWCFYGPNETTHSYLLFNGPLQSQMSQFCGTIGWDWDIQAFNSNVLQNRPPLIVRFTKFLLRILVVLATTMTIYNGIRYMAAAGWEDASSARQDLIYIAMGLIIALASLAIINLVNSITIGTINNLPGF